MMEYPLRVPTEPAGKREVIPRQTLTEWISDICTCKECRDGFVSKEVKGYETLFACPVCDRYKRDLYPYQSIPSAKRWMGSYTTYSEHEMSTRRLNRVEVVESLRNRAGKMPELNMETVGDGPF